MNICKLRGLFSPHTHIQVDAPSLLQRGLPRALPGLEEVTVESVKEGTQYKSGEFQDPPQLPLQDHARFLQVLVT